MISSFPLSLSLVATGLFGLTLLVVAVVSLMLYYHWVRYGIGVAGTFIVMVVYAVGIAVLLLAALGLLATL